MPFRSTDPVPPLWPHDANGKPLCPNACGESDAWGYAYLPDLIPNANDPSTKSPIPITGTGCPRFSVPSKGCENMGKINDGTQEGIKCDAGLALCSIYDTDRNCSTFIHELIHVGGVRHGDQGHKDFVYTLQCCICRELFGANTRACYAYACSSYKMDE